MTYVIIFFIFILKFTMESLGAGDSMSERTRNFPSGRLQRGLKVILPALLFFGVLTAAPGVSPSYTYLLNTLMVTVLLAVLIDVVTVPDALERND